MKKLIFAMLLIVMPSLASAQEWGKTIAMVKESIVNIESKDGRCTGFVIDNDKDLVMTAAHCDGEAMYVDLAPAKVIAKDVKNDLLIVKVEGLDRPALKFAAKNPAIGEQVASYGFGWGWERPIFRMTHVSDTMMTIPELEGGPWVVLDTELIPGQSGGAIFNVAGEVVSIVQRTSNGMGLGVGVEVIRAKLGRYVPEK